MMNVIEVFELCEWRWLGLIDVCRIEEDSFRVRFLCLGFVLRILFGMQRNGIRFYCGCEFYK